MDELFRFVLAALATWRVAFLVAREDGPGKAFARLRRLGGPLACVKCASVWAAAPFAFFVGRDWVEWLVSWLALSGAASLIDEATRPPFEWQGGGGDELLRGEAHGGDD